MRDQNTAVVPLLSLRNGTKAIEFYKAAFGAREVFRVENEQGEVVAGCPQTAPNSGSPTNLPNTSTSARSLWAVDPFGCF